MEIGQLTEVLIIEGAGCDDNALASCSNRMRGAHVCLRSDGNMHPVSLTPQFLTRPRTRKDVIDFTLRSVDIIDCRRGAERGL